MYDVVIIGAGVTGSASARELSRYKLNICVVDKEEDVCAGTSKANSAIVHSGIDCTPGTLMAELNVKGNEMMEPLSKELDFSFKRNGSLILCFSEDDRPNLEALFAHAVLPIKGKGSSNFAYGWIPVVGPIIGGLLAVGLFNIIPW